MEVNGCISGGLGCNLADYIKKENPSKMGNEKLKRNTSSAALSCN